MALELKSQAFSSGASIPREYTCEARDISPSLIFSGVPAGAVSLALICDDPDAPMGTWVHWVLYNIPANTTNIPTGATIGTAGLNSAGGMGYVGPCPPPQYEPKEHRYIFSLYALREMLTFTKPPTADQVRAALAPLLLAETKLIGRYSRK